MLSPEQRTDEARAERERQVASFPPEGKDWARKFDRTVLAYLENKDREARGEKW